MSFRVPSHVLAWVGVTIAASLLTVSTAAAAPANAAKEPPPASPEPDRPLKADLDRNKLFDDLEADLRDKGDKARVRVIVTLPDPATEERVRGLERRLGSLQVGHRFDIVPGFAATVTTGQARALARQADVTSVEADSPVRATNDTAQSAFGVTAARAAVPGLDGSGVKVAVIDTGVATSHVDLAGKVVSFRDYVGGRSTSYDDNGHGTHVAATIAGKGAGNPAHTGAAPAATLVVAKVLDAAGGGFMSNTTAAIDWAVNRGSQVINLSLGASGCADGSDATSRAVNNAAARGIFVAVAAGNEGAGACTVGSPGAATGATTVGAMADLAHGGYHLADFSSRGRAGTAGAALKPDVAAPGVGIVSADASTTNGYTAMSGTSMATPFVAGVGALMLEKGVPAASLKSTIESTAHDWGVTGDDIEFGSGRLDAYRAIMGADDPSGRPAHAFRRASLPATGALVEYPIEVGDVGFPVTAMLVHPGVTVAYAATPDFDLQLFDPSGAELARAFTSARQETVAVAPSVTGTYTLRVSSYSGSGDFQVDWSAGPAAPPPVEAPVPPPVEPVTVSTTIAPRGLSPAGDLSTLNADDDRYYTLASPTLASGSRTTTWVATFANVPTDITGLTVTYRGKNSVACNQRISLQRAGTWVLTASGSVSTTESTIEARPTDEAKNYVANGNVKVRVQCTTSAANFTTYGELLTLTYDRTA